MAASFLIRLVLGLCLLLGCAVVGFAQTVPEPTDEPIKLKTDLVVLDAFVHSAKTQRAVGNLQAKDFVLFEAGVQQEITHFSQDRLPLSVILLLDVSASVRASFADIRNETLKALQHFKPEDEVAVQIFATRSKLIQPFTNDRSLVADAIGRIEPHLESVGVGTRLSEGVYQAALNLRQAPHPQGRRVIIIVTDNISGDALAKHHPKGEALRQVVESGGVVCGIVVRSAMGKVMRWHPSTLIFKDLLRSSTIQTYSSETGGVVGEGNPAEFTQVLTQMIDDLRNRYSFGYLSTNSKNDGAFRKIQLKPTALAEQRNGRMKIRTRRGYYAPVETPVGVVTQPVQ